MILSLEKQSDSNMLPLQIFLLAYVGQTKKQSLSKKNIIDAFRNIPVAPHQGWLLCFQWERVFYQETCFLFGLSTSFFLLNLFGEAFHWMLIFYLNWTELEHYLDNFIHILEKLAATLLDLKAHEISY